MEAAPADFRFPTTNRTRHCFTRYIECHRYVASKREGAPECQKFAPGTFAGLTSVIKTEDHYTIKHLLTTRRDKWCCLLCKLFFSSAANQMSLISCCPFVTLLHDYLALIISGFLQNLEHLDWHYSDSHYIVWGHTHG